MNGISNHRDAIAARKALEEEPKLTLVVNTDLETKGLETDTARLTVEVQKLSAMIRVTTRDLNVMKIARDRAATALETSMRALAARVKA